MGRSPRAGRTPKVEQLMKLGQVTPNLICVRIGGRRQICAGGHRCERSSVCSEECVRRYRLRRLPNSSNRSFFGADGNPIVVRGETDIDIDVNGYRMQGRFKIVKNLTYTIIIGIDILTDHKAIIDVGGGCVYFGDHLTATPLCDGPIAHVSTVRTVVVPPFSEALVLAKIDNNYKLQTSLVEPVKELHQKRLALARCVIEPNEHRTNIRVLNPTSATVYLKKRTQIGTITPIDEVAINDEETENIKTPKTKFPACSIGR